MPDLSPEVIAARKLLAEQEDHIEQAMAVLVLAGYLKIKIAATSPDSRIRIVAEGSAPMPEKGR